VIEKGLLRSELLGEKASAAETDDRAKFPRQRERGSLTAIKLDGDSLEDSSLGIAYFEPTRG